MSQDELSYTQTYVKSKRHPWMSNFDRAAQFAPFAALTGHKETLDETARYVSKKRSLSQDAFDLLNQKIQLLIQHKEENPLITVTYFLKDSLKEGGCYVTLSSTMRNIDHQGYLHLEDDTKILLDDILEIDSSLFQDYF
ncbi:hypothetical protein EII25_05495 [Erysipelotrichaceae bacterium OH741_COT-311]|nr:hypothetical protein EII25_05495 [Erysipelotrichaceae bacterium OH741_COT-311]